MKRVFPSQKKSVILIITFAIMIIIIMLTLAAINLMRQQARVSEHHIQRRRRGMAAVQGGMVHAYEYLQRGIAPFDNPPPPSITDTVTVGDVDVNICVLFHGEPGLPHCNNVPCPVDIPSDYCIQAHVNYGS